MRTKDEKEKKPVGRDQGTFIRHLEESTQKVCSWPKWKQRLLGVSIRDKQCGDTVQK
jgi:hypothetical protein